MITVYDENILLFTDLHAGIKSNSILRLDITEKLIDDMVRDITERGIKTVIFCGDWHHERPSISVETLNRTIDMIDRITAHAKLYFIIGNHDILTETSTDKNSVRFLKDNPNVVLVTEPTEAIINGKNVLLCPWLSDLDGFEKEGYDVLFGHFHISKKYIIESYIEEHSSEKISSAEVTGILMESGYDLKPADVSEINSVLKTDNKINSTKHIGNFIELCKKGGRIYAGDIHSRKEFKIKNRKFTFLGSPLQLTWGDMNNKSDTSDRGYYILDSELNASFIENNNSPMYRKFFLSQLPLDEKPLDDIFDRKIIDGNFVKLIADKQFEFGKLNEIIAKIESLGPVETCEVEYDFTIDFSGSEKEFDRSSLSASKSQYVVDYLDTVKDEVLVEFSVDREEVRQALLDYIEKAEVAVG